MLTVNAYAATAPTEPLTPTRIARRDLGPHDVLIEVKYCGICHTDIHWVRGDWGAKDYPVVPGHEMTGIVTEAGGEVTRHLVGDRVGVGCLANSCRTCANCRKGYEQYCLEGNVLTYGSVDRDGTLTQGGYSTHIVVTEDFVLKIPDGLALDVAAPLLCAGATTFSPLERWGAGPGKKVAVIGVGGLGHVAVKIAHAMGAEVTALSRGMGKKDDALRLGADHYHATADPDTFARLAGEFDLILNTVSAPLDVDAFLSTLAIDGTLAVVGATPEYSLHRANLVRNQRALSGSLIAGLPGTQRMLDFCAAHGVGAEIETIDAEQINEAYDRVLASDVRYRFVLDNATLV
ncbi:NAD(P)-dependent alcohol dehydrogenase [Actinospica durhamensis]|uniref:alcohol dehydrogenase (NADP(+)) n=1 Tax=Actinospica durhamensis TaxID=1508375 RepID=A0A941ISG2_9ACTN|nr:NAD(P)-dependent alcohol dehydrogenase [Actinospica durhamensis]MBR7838469.1 NAD(P)-dependent alcohol dehydrogenase [Actinospica durhamensis]